MRDTTRQMIEMALDGDKTASAPERKAVLAAADGRELIAKPKLITRKQTAEILGCSTKTISRYIQTGIIREVRFTARRVRFVEAEIIRLAREGVQDDA